jgi:hypothetical protein
LKEAGVDMNCEVNRSAGFDPTGEWAVECGAEGEYCPVCELVVCAYCHKTIAADFHIVKKLPTAAHHTDTQRKTG